MSQFLVVDIQILEKKFINEVVSFNFLKEVFVNF